MATGTSQRRSRRLLRRWLNLSRFVRNAIISLPTFLCDLILLVVLVRLLAVNYMVASVVAFLVTTIVSYFLTRRLVFRGSGRGMKSGLLYFLAIAAASAALLTPLMGLFVGVLHLDIVVARILATVIVSLGGYYANRYFNFRKKRPPQPQGLAYVPPENASRLRPV